MDPETLEKLRRNSQLAISKEGGWTWGGRAFENPRVQALFHRGVAVREDGEVIVSVGRMWAYLATEATAFFVATIAGLDGPAPTARLLGERELPLDAATVAGWGPDERLYLWFAGLGGPAICLRAAHHALTAHLIEDAGRLAIALGDPGGATGDRRIPVALLKMIPTASAPRPL